MARMKAVEYLDPEFNKALEKREKKQEREKREKDREKERSRNEPKLFKGSVGGVVTTFHTTVDINHLDVAPTVLEVVAGTQEAARNRQQKIPVTLVVEPIISLRVVPESKY